MSKRKDFILAVMEGMKTDARTVFKGHGISATMLGEISNRPGVIAKLASFVFDTPYSAKGVDGMKKAKNFKFSAYKNFNEFNGNAREDVESFVESLAGDDQANFKNDTNVVTILLLPNTTATQYGETPEEDVTSAITDQSVMMKFDSAVRREYKIPGASYVTIMFGESAIKPAEVQKASVKAKDSKAKVAKTSTPAGIKAKLSRKANKKLKAIKAQKSKLQDKQYAARLQMQQLRGIGAQFGVKGASGVSIATKMKKFNAQKAQVVNQINALDADDKKAYKLAMSYLKKGKTSAAKRLLKEIGNPAITEFALSGGIATASQLVGNKAQALKDKVKELKAKGEQLLLDLSLAPAEKRRSIQSMISKNNAQIRDLKTRLGAYKDLTPNGITNKAKMVKETTAALERNLAKGIDVVTALNKSLEKLPATPSQKAIVKQQIMQQVANGLPLAYATQQAIQEQIPAQVIPQAGGMLNKTKSLQDVLSII